ncbi:hypothetical protein [Sinomonas halotolerans]|uniref:Uncharacterized protein n=1 Tax=Sinomonas halotolerans TaxID=1644133 RepID=A0ABU9X4A9_9MICC
MPTSEPTPAVQAAYIPQVSNIDPDLSVRREPQDPPLRRLLRIFAAPAD